MEPTPIANVATTNSKIKDIIENSIAEGVDAVVAVEVAVDEVLGVVGVGDAVVELAVGVRELGEVVGANCVSIPWYHD